MAPGEHQAINEINETTSQTRALIGVLVADFRVFKTKLLGDDEEELPTGRIPTIEAEIKKIKRRQDVQARILWTASGFALCVNVLGWLLTLISSIAGVFKK